MMESRDRNADPNATHICDECGHEVTTTWHAHTFQYGSGEAAALLAVRLPVRRCDRCDFDYLDDEGERLKHEAVCHHLGVLTPQEIRDIRGHIGLSRSAFARLTGIGEASLGRWENGIKIQTPGYDRYLRLLNQTGIAPLLKQLDDGRLAPQPRNPNDLGTGHNIRAFRALEVSPADLQREASFSLRPAA